MVADVLDDLAAEVAERLGERAVAVHLDVTDESQWEAAVAVCVERFGAPSVLVNNAGILQFNQLVNTAAADFRKVVDVNLTGTFLGMKVVAPAMAGGAGRSSTSRPRAASSASPR